MIKPIPVTNISKIDSNRIEWVLENKHLCIYPWNDVQVFFMEPGISPCCNLVKEPAEDVFAPIKQLKASIEQGQADEARCSRCFNCEKDGKISERMRPLISYDTKRVMDFIEKREVDEFAVHATLSSLCNMSCRSCAGTISSLYNKIWNGDDTPSATLSEQPKLWNAVLDSLTQAVKEHDNVIFIPSGGEGMVQPDFFKLIDWTIEQNISQQLTLRINTNGSVVTEELFQRLSKNFRALRLAISVDSVYENYQYVRWPVAWEKISQNLDTFVSYKKQMPNFDFMLTPVFSINNIAYLPDWIKFFQAFSERHNIPYLSTYDLTLFHPEWLDIQYLPDYIKPPIVESINAVLDNPFLQDDTNKLFRMNVIKMRDLLLNPVDPTKQAKFWWEYLTKTARWDTLTNTDLQTNNKKLYDLLSAKDINNFKILKSAVNK